MIYLVPLNFEIASVPSSGQSCEVGRVLPCGKPEAEGGAKQDSNHGKPAPFTWHWQILNSHVDHTQFSCAWQKGCIPPVATWKKREE